MFDFDELPTEEPPEVPAASEAADVATASAAGVGGDGIVLLQIYTLDGTCHTLRAHGDSKICEVKDAIEVATGVPAYEQHLCCGTRELADTRTLGRALQLAEGIATADITLARVMPDRDVWVAKVSKRGLALQQAPAPFRADPEVVLQAAASDVWALAYAASSLKEDRAFAEAALVQSPEVLRFLPECFKADRALVLAAVQARGTVLKDASPALRADPEVAQAAMEQDVASLLHVSADLLSDRDFVARALRHDWRCLKYVAAEIRADKLFLRDIAKQLGAMHVHAGDLVDLSPGDVEEMWLAPEKAKDLLDRQKAVVIDARSSKEYDDGHATGAISMPAPRFADPVALESRLSFRRLQEADDWQVFIVYSDNGSMLSRDSVVAEAIKHNRRLRGSNTEKPSRRVFRLEGGLNEWKRKGLPVEGDPREMWAGVPLTHGDCCVYPNL